MENKRKHFIVLGAGASHDFIDPKYISTGKVLDWETFKPPLASEIFNPAKFGGVIQKYNEASQLSASVLSALRAGKDLEEFMQELRERGGHRIPQLVELVFYLGDLFQLISSKFRNNPGNNYSDLIGRIRDNGGEACMVTFNYDTLLETNLGTQFAEKKHELDDYIRHDIQVIKIHGSCEWSYVSGPFEQYEVDEILKIGGINKYLVQNPSRVYGIKEDGKKINTQPEIIPQRNFQMTQKNTYGTDEFFESYPALAIPVRTKHTYVCPDYHIEELKKALSQTCKILIIGWKAADENLLEIFEEVIKYPVEFTIVAGKGSKTAEEIKEKIRQKVKVVSFKIVDQGFTGFMGSQACDDFFSK